MSVLALIPARSGSKGIPGKNWRTLGTATLIDHAVICGHAAGCMTVLSTDYTSHPSVVGLNGGSGGHYLLVRPVTLAQDDTPMIEVVKHALEQIPGEPDQIIVLLQPTQPFRTPAHVKAAIALLEEQNPESVVSVRQVPTALHEDYQLTISDDVDPWLGPSRERLWRELPTYRQSLAPRYVRDGTVYAFRRNLVKSHRSIYGHYVLPLIIPAEETCELDTESDWANVERRWNERHVQQS